MSATKERWRITVPARRRELKALIENKLIEHDKSKALFAHTYPYGVVAEAMTEVVIAAEKGQPHLWGPDKDRQTRLARVVANAQDQFDKDKHWYCRYDHEKAAVHIVGAIVRAEITR